MGAITYAVLSRHLYGARSDIDRMRSYRKGDSHSHHNSGISVSMGSRLHRRYRRCGTHVVLERSEWEGSNSWLQRVPFDQMRCCWAANDSKRLMSNLCHCFECFIGGGGDCCVHLGPPRQEAHLRPRVENKKATRKFFVSTETGAEHGKVFLCR